MSFGSEQEFAQLHAELALRREVARMLRKYAKTFTYQIEPGYVYAPYIPAFVTPVFDFNAYKVLK